MSQDAGYGVKTGTLEWKSIAPGIDVRLIRCSEETGQFTVMLHAKAGSVLPRHRHLAPAEFYILKGRGVHPQTGAWAEGDYVYEHTGAIHDAFAFDQEITLLMVSHGPIVRLDQDDSMTGMLIDAI
jgi:quercetin dioxygenase-like cupin family protein